VGGCIWGSEKETLRLRVKGLVDEGGRCGLADRGVTGEGIEQSRAEDEREFTGHGWKAGGGIEEKKECFIQSYGFEATMI
jgi:hypothetical protein